MAGLIGCQIENLQFDTGSKVVAVNRYDVPLPVDESLVLEADDLLTVVGPEEEMPAPGEPAPLK